MTSMLLVTLIAPRQRIDLQVPAEIIISDLLPALLEICDMADDAFPLSSTTTWELSHAGMTLLASSTLRDVGVQDGAILSLQPAHVARETPAHPLVREVKKPFAPLPVQPSAETGGIGVTWSTDDMLA
jgi:hypothetical protein